MACSQPTWRELPIWLCTQLTPHSYTLCTHTYHANTHIHIYIYCTYIHTHTHLCSSHTVGLPMLLQVAGAAEEPDQLCLKIESGMRGAHIACWLQLSLSPTRDSCICHLLPHGYLSCHLTPWCTLAARVRSVALA